jgi:hypothetical protein
VVSQDQRIPTEDTGVPPPPTPQGQGTGRGRGVQIAFIGCGGLIGLFLLLVIAIALSEDQDTTKDQKQDRAEDKPKKAKSDVGVREDAMMGDRVLRVEEFEGNYRPPREFDRPDPGNEFVRVQVTLSNTSNQPFSINPLDFELQDSAGVQRQRELITDLPNAIDLAVSPQAER